MATERQIAANRLNAQASTGPRTEHGKRRSRRNALRHGLTAESVVAVFEDAADYRKFESTIIADYAPESAIERALLVRLASLLWRLRRAVAIESGLFQIQGQMVRERRLSHKHDQPGDPLKVFYDLLRRHSRDQASDAAIEGRGGLSQQRTAGAIDPREMAVCFLRLGNINEGMLDLIGRYETRLWRQLAQTILILESMRRASPLYRTRRQPGLLRTGRVPAGNWRGTTL
jgi:hypothetical protein